MFYSRIKLKIRFMFVRKFKLGQDDNQSTISAKKLPTQNQFRVGNSCYVLILVINYFAADAAAEAAAATSDAAASAVEAADAATASTADAAAATSDAAA